MCKTWATVISSYIREQANLMKCKIEIKWEVYESMNGWFLELQLGQSVSRFPRPDKWCGGAATCVFG